MKKIILGIFAFVNLLLTANAASFHFEGNIANHNDVITVNFTLANDATNVRLWTDSFLDGLNFDPITALWNKSTGELIDENDDDDTVGAGQTIFDSGFILDELAAGDYFFTIATYNNFAVGSNIAEGFEFDGQAPIAIALWDQPHNGTGKGTYWSAQLEGVDSAGVNNVPVPAAVWMFASCVLGLIYQGRRKAKQG